jgi:hypothetical protein
MVAKGEFRSGSMRLEPSARKSCGVTRNSGFRNAWLSMLLFTTNPSVNLIT